MRSIVIENRFCGPPNSANGGYICGLLAAHIDGNAEVTLLAPPPLGQRLDIAAGERGVELRKDATILATARSVRFDVPEIPIVDFSEAKDAASRSPFDDSRHPLPMCFVLCAGRRARTAMVSAFARVPCRRALTARPEHSRHPGCLTPIWRARMGPSPASSSGPHWIAQPDMPVLARAIWG